MVKGLIEPSLIETSLQGFSVTFSKVQNVYLQQSSQKTLLWSHFHEIEVEILVTFQNIQISTFSFSSPLKGTRASKGQGAQRDKGEGRSEIGFGLWYDIKIYLKFEICFLLDEVNVQNSFSEMDSFILFCRLFFLNSFDQCISAIVMFNYSCIILYMFSKFILFSSLNFCYTVLAGQINFTYS